MASNYEDVDILCPFFRELTKKSISCEGLTDDSIIKQWFEIPKNKEIHANVFCKKSYKSCEIFMMLEKKYEE